MKKVFTIIFIISLLALPTYVLAIDLGSNLTKEVAVEAGYSDTTDETTFAQMLGTVVKGALSIVGIIFTILMVYAGYIWMTARGEEERTKKAKTLINQAIIGLIITLGAYSITAFVVPKLLERTTGSNQVLEDVQN